MADLATTLTASVTALVNGLTAGATTQNLYSPLDEGNGTAASGTYTRNASLFAAAIDLTCIASYTNVGNPAPPYGMTAITPSFAISAAHLGEFGAANWVRFIAANGTISVRYPSLVTTIGDINLYKLCDVNGARQALSGSITPARLLPATFASYINSACHCVYENQDRVLRIGSVALGTSIATVSGAASGLASWYSQVRSGDSGHALGVILAGRFVLLGTWWGNAFAPELASNLTALQAAITGTGSAETLDLADLSSFTVVGAPVMADSINVFAAGGGDYNTLQDAFDTEVIAGTGTITFRCRGDVGSLDWQANTSSGADITRSAVVITADRTQDRVTQTYSASVAKIVYAGSSIGGLLQASTGGGGALVSWTFDGMMFSAHAVSCMSLAPVAITDIIKFTNCMFRIDGDMAGTTSGMLICTSGAGILEFDNCPVFCTTAQTAATASRFMNITAAATQTTIKLRLYHCSIDVRNLTYGVRLTYAAGRTLNVDFRGLMILGATTAAAGITVSSGGTLNIDASSDGNVSSDTTFASGYGTHSVTGLIDTDEWTDPVTTYNFTLKSTAASKGILTTSAVALDINSVPRPQYGTSVLSVDAGAFEIARYPTLITPAVGVLGTTITATISTATGAPLSGTGHFTVSGTTATVASWAVSGATLTITLTGNTVKSTDTITFTYARSNDSTDLVDGNNNALAAFVGVSVSNGSTVSAGGTNVGGNAMTMVALDMMGAGILMENMA